VKELKLLASKKTADAADKSPSDSSSDSDTEASTVVESDV